MGRGDTAIHIDKSLLFSNLQSNGVWEEGRDGEYIMSKWKHRAIHAFTLRRDRAHNSGFLASSQMMEVLLDKGLYTESQNAGLLFGLGQVKHFPEGGQRL